MSVTERALAEKADRYRSLFAYIPNGVFSLDLEGRLTDANDAFQHLVGRVGRQAVVARRRRGHHELEHDVRRPHQPQRDAPGQSCPHAPKHPAPAGTARRAVDRDAVLHAAVAAPLFVCQPLALCLLGARLRPTYAGTALVLLLTGLVTAAAAAAFVLGVGPAGVLERVALWPVLVALAWAAVVVAVPVTGRRAGTG